MTLKITPATKGSDVYLTDNDGKYVAHVSAAGHKTLALFAVAEELLKAAKKLSDECGIIEEKDGYQGRPKYLSPSGIMVSTELIVKLRSAIVKAGGKI